MYLRPALISSARVSTRVQNLPSKTHYEKDLALNLGWWLPRMNIRLVKIKATIFQERFTIRNWISSWRIRIIQRRKIFRQRKIFKKKEDNMNIDKKNEDLYSMSLSFVIRLSWDQRSRKSMIIREVSPTWEYLSLSR